MKELLSSTDVLAIQILLVTIAGLCWFILILNKDLREANKKNADLLERTTKSLTEITVLIKGFLLK